MIDRIFKLTDAFFSVLIGLIGWLNYDWVQAVQVCFVSILGCQHFFTHLIEYEMFLATVEAVKNGKRFRSTITDRLFFDKWRDILMFDLLINNFNFIEYLDFIRDRFIFFNGWLMSRSLASRCLNGKWLLVKVDSWILVKKPRIVLVHDFCPI